MRISEVHAQLVEANELPPDKRGRGNKGVKELWKALKRQDAEKRNEQTHPHDRRQYRLHQHMSTSGQIAELHHLDDVTRDDNAGRKKRGRGSNRRSARKQTSIQA